MRADKFFADKFGSRTKAAEELSKGNVLRNGKPLKPSDDVSDSDRFQFISLPERFVSNGGYKLSRAIKAFSFDVSNQIWLDIGASTGGFTDCLLQNGAKRVYCVDVGESQLDKKLACDERVVVMDRTNARYLTRDAFDPLPYGVVSDVSFISLKLIIPTIAELIEDAGFALLLIKPQFEVGKGKIGKSGIVAKSEHPSVLRELYRCALQYNLFPQNVTYAPLRNKKNIEYVMLLQKGGRAISESEFVIRAMNFQGENE